MGIVPPGSTLVYTIELVAAEPPMRMPRGDRAFTGAPLRRRLLPGHLRAVDFDHGEGDPARPGDTLVVHFTGRIEDGTVFASTREEGPFTFVLGEGRVIPGWEAGLAGMRVGGLRKLVVPPGLAYGDRASSMIPARSTLTFTVELMALRHPVGQRLDLRGNPIR
jgi:FKBP-type peptidyl-prolyl cis-trans isomerase